MSIYRLSLTLKNGLALLCGFVLLVALVFSSGVIVGFTSAPRVAAAPPASAAPAIALTPAAVTVAAECPVAPPALTLAVADAETLPRPDVVPRSEAEPEPDYTPNLYSVQIGAFRKPDNAQNMIALLRKRGYEPVVIPERVNGEVLRSVRIADQADWNRAWSLAKEFTAREQMDAMVVLAQQ